MFFGLIFTRRRHDITLKKKENKKTVQAAGECAMRCNWFATRMPIACGQTYTHKQALSRVLAGAPSIKGFGERRQRANLSKSCCLCCTSNFCSHDSRTGDDISQPAQRTSDIVDSIQLSGGICVCNARDSSFTLRRMPPRPCDDSGGDGQIQRWSKPHIHIDTLSTCPNRNSGRQWRGMCFAFYRNYI